MFGRYGKLTAEEESDANFFLQTVHRSVSESVLRTFCEACGGEFVPHPVALMAYDVIGVNDFMCRELVRRMRPAGVIFRYFDSHTDRLAEFQSRLDAAKRRVACAKTT